ncbi:hypothetical protein NXT3_PB00210 (plasmid) [Sinorhizobium fredii]|uniref:Uncharacterized protein n=1 Tax=Rhizobium fredii TaxID=380 RepID=A0A2L0HBJ3_RHIFR|nr:hypothetical protein NXT3_PB00210 [Sinorhizobium fredii]
MTEGYLEMARSGVFPPILLVDDCRFPDRTACHAPAKMRSYFKRCSIRGPVGTSLAA